MRCSYPRLGGPLIQVYWSTWSLPVPHLLSPPESVFSGAGFSESLIRRVRRRAPDPSPASPKLRQSGSAGLPWSWKKSFLTFSNWETPLYGRCFPGFSAAGPTGGHSPRWRRGLGSAWRGSVGAVLPHLTVSLPAPAGKIISAAVSLPHTSDRSNLWAGARAVEGSAQTGCAGGLRTSGGRISLLGDPPCFES